MNTDALNAELRGLLTKSNAHADFDKVIKGFPIEDAGKRPKSVPYSGWQLLEHIRIAQADILEFVSSPTYKEKNWPEDYWPKDPAPPSASAWTKSVAAVRKDRKKLITLLEKSDPLEEIKFAGNKTLLKELLMVVDHTAYHLGELCAAAAAVGELEGAEGFECVCGHHSRADAAGVVPGKS